MGLNIRRISDALGAEISGVDLREPADEATKSEFRQALLDHHLIVVPGQQLSDLQHKQFCEFFGEIHAERTVPDRESDEIVGMLRVSNFHKDGILPNGEMWFHSDQCYFDIPCKCTSLHSIVAPKSGGHTRFSNCIKAYEALPEEKRFLLKGLAGMNIYDYHSPNRCKVTGEHPPDAHRYPHPLVRFHPETGKRSLYLNRLMTDHVVDMEVSSGRQLLGTLFDQLERDEFVYEHAWAEGDLVIWDNRCLVHARTDFDPSEKRLLRRFLVAGEKPVQ